jgi:acyl-CoA thioester hydrolase
VTDAFRHRTTIQVRFRDADSFGHVNNAVFFSYVELARIRYLVDLLQPERGFEGMPLILAQVECDFRSPILFGQEVTVETRVDRIGRSSIAMSHRMTASPDDRVVGDVQSVLVTYDYSAARPMPVPEDWRERIGAHEQTPFATDAPTAAAAAAG